MAFTKSHKEEFRKFNLQQKIVLLNQLKAETKGLKDTIFFARYWLGIDVNPFQERVLREMDGLMWGTKYSYEDLIELMMKAGNRSGKTVLLAILHIKFARYKIGIKTGDGYLDFKYRTFAISPIARQARECGRYIEDILSGRMTWIKNNQRFSNQNGLRLKNFFEGKNENIGEYRYTNRSVTYAFSTGSDMGAGFQGLPGGFISYDECVQCYSEDTEVLTANGWKKFNQVKIGERVPSLNLKTKKVETAETKQVIWENYEGRMVYLGNTEKNTRVNFLLTPNHKQVIRRSLGANNYGRLEIAEAKDLVGKHFKLERGGKWTGRWQDGVIIPGIKNARYSRLRKDIVLKTRDFLELLGFYISEGCLEKNSVCLAQMPYSKGYADMEDLLSRLPFSWTKNRHGFRIFNKQLAEYLRKLVPGKSWEKRISRAILELSPAQLKPLFKALMLGDGTLGRVYGTSSPGLADDFMELALKLGFVPTMKVYDNIGEKITIRKDNSQVKHLFHVISLNPKTDVRVNHHEKNNVSLVDYKGKVGCLWLDKNHTLMVRRNGKVMWSGNSHHLEEELDTHIYSRLGDYGKLMILIATPDETAPSQQYYYHLSQEARAGNNRYVVMEGSYMENIFIEEKKRISHAKMLQERDPVMARQILEGAFVSTGGAMFSPNVIEQLWNGNYKGESPIMNHQYLISADWGMAEGGDESVFLVWDITDLPVRIVWAYAKRGGDPYELMAVYRNLTLDYNNGINIMDTTGLGGTILKKLLKDLKPIPFDSAGKSGPDNEKQKALAYAKILMTKNRQKREVDGREIDDNKNYGWIRSFYLPKLATQLATYKLDDKKIKQDWVSAFYIGCWYIYRKFAESEVRQKSIKLNPFRRRNYDTQIRKVSVSG